jgi:hypothetical protein
VVSQRSWVALGYRWLPARRLSKVALLQRLVEMVRRDGLLTLEGDLSRCHAELNVFCGSVWYQSPWFFEEFDNRSHFRRVSLLIDPSTLDQITRVILPRIGIVKNVVHIIVSQRGAELVGAFDNFHPECLVAGPDALPLLESLHAEHLIRSYQQVKPDERFWHALSTNGMLIDRIEQTVS